MSPRLRWLSFALLVLLAPGCSTPRQMVGSALIFGSVLATGAAVASLDDQGSSPQTRDADGDAQAAALAIGTAAMTLGAVMLLPPPLPARPPAGEAPASPRADAPSRRAPATVSSAPLPTACPPRMMCLPAVE